MAKAGMASQKNCDMSYRLNAYFLESVFISIAQALRWFVPINMLFKG